MRTYFSGTQSGFGAEVKDDDLDNIPQMFDTLLKKGKKKFSSSKIFLNFF